MPVRIIVNNKEIYPLLNDKPVVIPVEHNYPRIVATDGFHYTQPLELKYTEPSYYRFKVSCAIDDLQLLGGGFVLVLLYLIGFLTDLFIIKLLSFAPLICFLVIYYVNKKKFIRIVPVR